MANFQIYSNCFVKIDGKLLTEEATVSVDKKSGLNPVFTTVKGYAGMSQGAGYADVTIESAVPATDFEFAPDAYLLKPNTTVELTVIMAGRQTVCQGFITDATYSHSVNKESQLHLKLMCEITAFE